MPTIQQAENLTLNVPVVENNNPVDVSLATDIIVTLQLLKPNGLAPFVGYQYSLNTLPGYGDLTINVNNVSVDLTLETNHTQTFEPGTYQACIVVKTPDPTFVAGKRDEYTTKNVLTVQAGCNTTDLMP